MRPIPVFPNELTLEIVGHLTTSPSALVALTQVSRSFRALTTPYLYRVMTKTSGPAHRRFLLTLEQHPSLGSLVEVYHTPHGLEARSFALWIMLRDALLNMPNLMELVVRSESSLCLPPRFRFLPQGNAPFQLERFVWGTRSWKPKQAIDFLSTQRNIQFLAWESEFNGPMQYAGTLFLQEWRDSEQRRNDNQAPQLPPGGFIFRYDTWAIDGGPEIPPPPPGSTPWVETWTREAIKVAPGMKTFRTLLGVWFPDMTRYIRFQYTRQRSLEDRTFLDGEANWYLDPLPGRRHPYT